MFSRPGEICSICLPARGRTIHFAPMHHCRMNLGGLKTFSKAFSTHCTLEVGLARAWDSSGTLLLYHTVWWYPHGSGNQLLCWKVKFWDEVKFTNAMYCTAVPSLDTVYCYITLCPETDGRVLWKVHISIWGHKIILVLFNSMIFAGENSARSFLSILSELLRSCI